MYLYDTMSKEIENKTNTAEIKDMDINRRPYLKMVGTGGASMLAALDKHRLESSRYEFNKSRHNIQLIILTMPSRASILRPLQLRSSASLIRTRTLCPNIIYIILLYRLCIYCHTCYSTRYFIIDYILRLLW